MNKVFKIIWNKSLGQKVIVAENAKCAGKSQSTTGNVVKTLVFGVAMVSGGQVWAATVDYDSSNNGNGNNNNVNYNSVTLAGNNNGTVIKNLANGSLASDSKEAVNGGQIYSLASQLASFFGGNASFTGTFTAPSYTIQTGSYNNVGSAFGAVNTELTSIKNSVTNGLADKVTQSALTNAVSDKVTQTALTNALSDKVTQSALTNALSDKVTQTALTNAVSDKVTQTALTNALSDKVTQTALTNALSDKVTQTALTNALLDKISQTEFTALSSRAVQYDVDGSNNVLDVIKLKGTNGTTIKNVADGTLASDSKDAVNGGQLFKTNQEVDTNKAAITNLGGRVSDTESALSSLTVGQNTLNSRAVQYDVDESNNVLDVIKLKGTNGTKISNVADGSSNNDAVNVGQLNTGLATKASQADFNVLDGRVTTNTKNISTLDDQINNASTGLKAKVTMNANGISALDNQINNATTGLKGKIAKNETNIAALDSQLNDKTTGLKTIVGQIDSRVATNAANITKLDGRVTTTEDQLKSLSQGQTALNDLAVQYDTSAKDVITLKGGAAGTKITNVKAGDILSANSTDVVNGGQLFATNQNVSNLTTLFNNSASQFASILGGNASFTNGAFTGPSYTIQGTSHTNVGSAFTAVNSELTAIKGSVELSSGTNLLAAQNYTDTKTAAALQDAIDYINDLKTTILNTANTYTDNAVSAGGEFVSVNGDESATAASATGTNSVAIGTNTTVTGNNSTAVGIGNTVSGNKSGAFGDPNTVTGNGSYVVGNDNTVSGDNTFVLGNNVNTSAANSVVLGNNSTSDRDNTVSVGSSTNQRQITNVAAGTEDTDAVNVAQLNQSSADTLASAHNYTDSRLAGLESTFQDYNLQNERRFQEVDKRFDRQGAMSAAMMNMAMSTSGLQGRNRIGVGAGLQGQEQAVAVGYQRMVNNNTSLTFSGALTREETSGGVGVGFGW